MNNGLPDLGALAQQKQQIPVNAAIFVRSVPDAPPELVDANGFVEMICIALRPLVHQAVREEFEALGLGGEYEEMAAENPPDLPRFEFAANDFSPEEQERAARARTDLLQHMNEQTPSVLLYTN